MFRATSNKRARRFIRPALLLITLAAAVPCLAQSQTSHRKSQSADAATSTCTGAQLSARHESEDAGAGHWGVIYSFKNRSSSPCTLTGLPRFVMLDRAGRRIPVQNSKPNAEHPMVVTLAPGGKAFFDVQFRSCKWDMSKRCRVSAKVQITAPGTQRGFVLRERLDPTPGSFSLSLVRRSSEL